MNFSDFLREISPFVVVVGSFARHEEHEDSDIDLYLRSRPLSEVDPEISNETYMPEIIEIVRRYNYVWSSVIVGHIAVERQRDVPRMVEISNHYRIPATSPVFVRNIYGIDFLCAVDNKQADFESCYDSPDWDNTLCDMVVRFPLPPAIKQE